MVRRTLSFALTLIAHTLSGQVIVGPERQLSVPDLQPAVFDQLGTAIASDGDGWLAAWTSISHTAAGNVLAATRIDGSGNVLDVPPIVIAVDNRAQATVTFGIDRYLVTWTTSTDLRARTVGRDGSLSPTMVIGSIASGYLVAIRAAWDGSRFLIVWAQDNKEPKHGVILDPTGAVIARDLLLLQGSSSLDFALAAGNQEFMVFEILDGYPIVVRATRIDQAGRPLQPVEIERATSTIHSLHASFDGHDYLVVWTTGTPPRRASGARLLRDGTAVRIAPLSIGDNGVNTVTWTGGEYILTLISLQGVDALRLDARGVPASPVVTVFKADQRELTISAAAWNGRALLITIDRRGDVYEKFLDRAPRLIDPVAGSTRTELIDPYQKGLPVPLSPSDQQAPAIASAGGGDSLIVWSESLTAAEAQLAMALPLHDGVATVERPIILARSGTPPVVASDGKQYFVTWGQPFSGTIGQRIDRRGAVIDPLRFVLVSSTTYYARLAMSYDGKNFVVAYKIGTCHFLSTMSQFVTRVSPAGMVVEPATIAIGGRSCGDDLSIASGSNGSLLAWSGLDGPTTAFITRGGTTAGPMKVFPMLSGYYLRAVWTGSRFIVADFVPASGGVEWLTFSENGAPLMHAFLPESSPAVDVASAAFTRFGDGALLVWSAANAGDHDIFGQRFAADGTAIGEPFVISAMHFDETNVAVAADADGRAQIVYQRTVDFPSVPGLTRIFTRQIDVIPPPVRRRASR